MLDFKLQYYFELYKNTSIVPNYAFKKKFIEKHGEFELLQELILIITNYQIDKYGETLPRNLTMDQLKYVKEETALERKWLNVNQKRLFK